MKQLQQIFKELFFYKGQAILFCLCLLFSLGIFISVDSLADSTENYINQDSKTLVGGDIIIETNREFSSNLTQALLEVEQKYNVIISNRLEFTSITYANKTNSSLLTQIKAVEPQHPLYGSIELLSGEQYQLKPYNVIVEENLLTQLNLKIGDNIQIGKVEFTIQDVLISEPDSPLNLFSLGPKILLPIENINETGLIGSRSRVEYSTTIKTSSDEESLEIYELLNSAAQEREDVDMYYQDGSTLQSFTTNFLFFIKLISIFIIFITGVGLTSTLSSYLSSLKQTIGIKKVLGTKDSSLVTFYLKTVLVLAAISFIFAMLFAWFFMLLFPYVLKSILPQGIQIGLSLSATLKGFFLALGISVLFTLYPISKLKNISPTDIFRKQDSNERRFFDLLPYYSMIVIFFAMFIFIELENLTTGLYILLGIVSLVIITFLFVSSILYFIKKIGIHTKLYSLKLAIKGLFRIGNKTLLIITSLSISLTLIFSLTFIETNLQNQFITSFPQDAPNMFIIDIPGNEKNNFSQFLEKEGHNATIFPIIRAPVILINGVDTQIIQDSLPEGDRITRQFSITYGDKVLDSELLTEGDSIFVDTWNKNVVQVSAMDEIAQRMGVGIGDRLVFLVQGIEIEAEIVSIRSRVEQVIGAFFYFTFEEEVLENAPQTLFATLRVNSSEINPLQTQIAKEFPSVTTINGETTAKTIGDIIGQLSSITSFFTVFSLIGGILILISSILATHEERLKESIYYKLVGGNTSFIRKIFIIEYMILAIISSLFALIFAMSISFLVSSYLLDITFSFLIVEGFIYIGITILTILFIGYLSILPILKKKPLEYIRENNIE